MHVAICNYRKKISFFYLLYLYFLKLFCALCYEQSLSQQCHAILSSYILIAECSSYHHPHSLKFNNASL